MADPKLNTLLVHAGEPEPRQAAAMPIYRSTVNAYRGGGTYADIPYPRLNNMPNHTVLAAKLAAAEGTEQALVTASGMAAISSALFAVLGKGGHVLVQDGLYGGTQSMLADELLAFGMAFDVIDGDDPTTWAAQVRPETRAVYVEAISNPTMQVIDHRAVVQFAREHGLVSMVDSTFASPVNFRPAQAGYDLVLHSATKYLNGHSDVGAGVVAGRAELVDRVWRMVNHLGGSLDPQGCYLLYRGLRTLNLRVRQQNANALQLARMLEADDAVAHVNYPGLESHAGHATAASMFDGYGGMLSFDLAGGQAAADRFLDAVHLAMVAPSLGGIETLLTQPAQTSHLGQSPEERLRMGITDGLIRMSVGIEDLEDLEADLRAGLAAAREA